MREFVALAACLNFRVAAGRLFISQPALTRHISAIESEIGLQLLNRSTHSVELTPCGEQAREDFTEMLLHYDNSIAKLRILNNIQKSQLRFGMLYYGVGQVYAYPMISRFQSSYPDVELSTISIQPHQVLEKLNDQTIDVGITLMSRLNNDSNCSFHLIDRVPMCAIVLPSHHLASKNEVSLEELVKERIIFTRMENDHVSYIKNLFRFHDLDLSNIVFTEHIDTLLMTLEKTNGVFIGTNMLATLPRNDLVFIKIDSDDFALDVSLVYLKENNNSAIAKLVKCSKKLPVKRY